MAEGGPTDCETQKHEISTLLKTSLKKGDTWYLIDTKWFKQWKKYVGYDSWDTSYVGEQSAYPGPIENAPLFKEDTTDTLKEHLIDELDYVLVPTEAWEKLTTWYGMVEGQAPVARKVIDHGMYVKQLKVEVYPMELKLCLNSDMENCHLKAFSRADTIDNIEKEMRNLFHITEETEVRLWNKYMSNTYEHLNKPDNTLQDAGLYQGQVIVIEQKNEDGSWPRQTKSVSAMTYSSSPVAGGSGDRAQEGASSSQDTQTYSSLPARSAGSAYNSTYSGSSYSSSSYYGSYDGYSPGRGSAAAGLCGLSNLGNTCFMNSALQCMSNCPPLTRFFMGDDWLEELNEDNPLGMKGEIAKSYAELVKTMWSGNYSYTIPRNFKIAVGRFAPQFSGYQQQDCQELMAFLLDGLHEDLNRIKKKPYIPIKDYDGRPDKEVAQEQWDNYRTRNDSIIVDTFHGLLKSTLVCPECSKISVTFDPFCYLSLPLPIKKERQIDVFLIPLDPLSKPIQYKLTVPKLGVVNDLCKALSKLTNIQPERMVVTDVYNHRFHKVFVPDEGLSHILDRDDIFIYEVPVTTGDDPDTLILPVYMREKRYRHGGTSYQHASTQLFGQPLLVPIPRKNCTYEKLYSVITERMKRYVKAPEEGDEWWKQPKKEEEDEGEDSHEGEEEEKEGKSVNGEVAMNGDDDDDSNDTGYGSKKSPEDESVVPEAESDEEEEEDVSEDGTHRLFSFHMVNSYGSAEMDGIRDDGKPIKFSSRSYVAVDWHNLAKEKFFDEKAAEEFEVDNSFHFRAVHKRQTIQLNECLQLFTTTEKLGAEDPWYCPQCKKHQQATKKFDLWSLPNYLVIHLKRFSYNRYWRDKLDAFVEFPTKGLNMKKYIIDTEHGPATYDLAGVCNHYGGMGGGHYTAYAKNKDDHQWYHFDDSSVSQTSEDSVVTKAGYVLVYQKRGLSDADSGITERDIMAAMGAPDHEGNNIKNGQCNGESDSEMEVN